MTRAHWSIIRVGKRFAVHRGEEFITNRKGFPRMWDRDAALEQAMRREHPRHQHQLGHVLWLLHAGKYPHRLAKPIALDYAFVQDRHATAAYLWAKRRALRRQLQDALLRIAAGVPKHEAL